MRDAFPDFTETIEDVVAGVHADASWTPKPWPLLLLESPISNGIGNDSVKYLIDKETPIPTDDLRVDEDLVRQLIQHRLREHRLPQGRAVGLRETMGDGRPCDACDQPIGAKQRAVLAMVSMEWMSVRFHIDCYTLWDAERGALPESEKDSDGTI